MSVRVKRDPYSGIRFKVKIGSVEFRATKITGLSRSTEVFKYREGADDETGGDIERKMLGQNTVEDVTIEKLFTGDRVFEEWYESARVGRDDVRRNVLVTIFDKTGPEGGDRPSVTYSLKYAIPIKHEIDDPDVARTDPMKERIIVSYEILERRDADQGDRNAVVL
jgi:phage tail-like protein